MFSIKKEINTTKPDLEYSSYGISDKVNKESKIKILLEIKNIKNTYYKYSHNKKYSEKLYKGALQETEEDNGVLVSNNSNIYDSDILNYIECRKELFENTKNTKNTENTYSIKKNFENFYKLESTDSVNVLYIIDLNERELFEYCYDVIKCYDNNIVKNLLFSVMINNAKKIDKYEIVKDYQKLKLNLLV